VTGDDLPPPGWERDLRAALRAARPEPLADRVLQLEFELGRFGEWLESRFEGPPPEDGPNTLNDHGRPLEGEGVDGLGRLVVEELLEPLRRAHFADVCPWPLDAEYAYLIEYGDHGDLDLPLHVDASHLTLNLCLGDWFEGGELVFEGLRCEGHRELPPAPEEVLPLDHAPGRAFVHLGAHRHRVAPVTIGRRRNLIVWARHEAAAERLGGNGPCEPWCGLHGRGRRA
jgi:hypothetical protein